MCQRADWRRHKRTCKTLQDRKILYRAASLLEQTIQTIRKHAFSLHLKLAHIDGPKIYLEALLPSEFMNASLYLGPISVQLDYNPYLLDAVTVYMGCIEAMVYLYSFTNELLAV